MRVLSRAQWNATQQKTLYLLMQNPVYHSNQVICSTIITMGGHVLDTVHHHSWECEFSLGAKKNKTSLAIDVIPTNSLATAVWFNIVLVLGMGNDGSS